MTENPLNQMSVS